MAIHDSSTDAAVPAVTGDDTSTDPGGIGVLGTSQGGFGVKGTAPGTGVFGESSGGWMGVYGHSNSENGGAGVMGEAVGVGTYGKSSTSHGVMGESASTMAGARLAEGILWMAGPANTLFAIACDGIAQLGSRDRELSDDEYNFANQVFLGALPPKDKIRLTDTIGGNDRAFTFPRFDGAITLNMGPTAWDDPRAYKGESRGADGSLGSYGRTFIHAMVHACQIHFSTDLDYLAGGLSTKVCEVSGSPYLYGPAGPDWVDAYNIEQQAQIVGDWANAVWSSNNTTQNHTKIPADINSPYFRYIQEYVRTGRY